MIGRGQRESIARETRTTGGALGLGLIALGGVLGALILVWLLVNLAGGQLRAGGFVFGMILLALLALPLVGAGWYLRSRGATESAEAEQFAARRAALDADRAVRRELARELEQRAAGLLTAVESLPAAVAPRARVAVRRLRDLAEDAQQPGYDAGAWLQAEPTGRDRLKTIRRYDDLVLEEARRLADLERRLPDDPAVAERLDAAIDRLEAHLREREDLFGRGKRAAAMAPQELLAAGAQLRRRLVTPLELGLGDAVSYSGADYLVRARLTYFAGGRTWHVYQLLDGRRERWLEVPPGAGRPVLYERRTDVPPPAGEAIDDEGSAFKLERSGSASVDIQSEAGTREGVFVEYRHYTSELDEHLVVEHWPDGPRVLLGHTIAPEDLQLWTRPAATE